MTSNDAHALYSFAQPPRRRDVGALRSCLASLECGTRVRATFHSRVYGTFSFQGPVRRSVDGAQWVLAGWFLTQGPRTRPAAELRQLRRDTAEVRAAGEGDLLPDCGQLVSGDVVSASLQTTTFGAFQITGPVRRTIHATRWIVGGWILSGDDGVTLASHTLSVERVRTATPELVVPACHPDRLGQGADTD